MSLWTHSWYNHIRLSPLIYSSPRDVLDDQLWARSATNGWSSNWSWFWHSRRPNCSIFSGKTSLKSVLGFLVLVSWQIKLYFQDKKQTCKIVAYICRSIFEMHDKRRVKAKSLSLNHDSFLHWPKVRKDGNDHPLWLLRTNLLSEMN